MFQFSLQRLSEKYCILRRNERNMIKNVQVFKLSTLCSCPILTKLEFPQQFFEKYSNNNFYESPSTGSRVVPCIQTDGQTDMTKLIFGLRNFVNAPNWLRRLLTVTARTKRQPKNRWRYEVINDFKKLTQGLETTHPRQQSLE